VPELPAVGGVLSKAAAALPSPALISAAALAGVAWAADAVIRVLTPPRPGRGTAIMPSLGSMQIAPLALVHLRHCLAGHLTIVKGRVAYDSVGVALAAYAIPLMKRPAPMFAERRAGYLP
jgi:hypothetical protein